MKGKVIVIEVNEIPPYLFEDYIRQNPNSALAALKERSKKFTTLADDVSEEFLYPSQSWASFNSGVCFDEHRVHWYNDSKVKCPQVWDELAVDYSVGTVNVVHSSSYKNASAFNYYIPDPYTHKTDTLPKEFEPFQRFKVSQTFKSGRVSSVKIGRKDVFDAIGFVKYLSLKSFSQSISSIFNKKFLGKNERLRNVEFQMHADIFFNCLKARPADINVFFTNHIASQMHRYIGAKYPNEAVEENFGSNWIAKFEGEVFYSVSLLDSYLRKIIKLCNFDEDLLVITSSMGQGTEEKYSKKYKTTYVAFPEVFWGAVLPAEFKYNILGAMVPQLTLDCGSNEEAEKVRAYLSRLEVVGLNLQVDLLDSMLTASVKFSGDIFCIAGKELSLEQLGAKRVLEDRQNTGKHIPEGILWVAGAKHALVDLPADGSEMSYLKYAPLVKGLVAKVLKGKKLSDAA